MKKNLLLAGLLVMGLGISMTSCNNDDVNDENDNNIVGGGDTEQNDDQNIDYTAENAAAWGNYAVNVAKLLYNDSEALYAAWKDGFAEAFKGHISSSGYKSANDCVQQIIEGCIDIANEVGTAKIGEPYDFWKGGHTTQAVYAVESWYSWHSRDDYKNNILSIANSMVGMRLEGNPNNFDYQSIIGNMDATSSVIVECMKNNATRYAAINVWKGICAAWSAIDDIPQPFRNNIGSAETVEAMEACADLVQRLETLNGLISENLSEEECQAIVDQFVDVVAVPTYAELVTKNKELLQAVQALQATPSNNAFATACAAWLEARQPWETSEAFLFGPVSELGLDPNMDSWPLDADGIANLLKSQKWSDMEWSGEYDDENEAIEAAQSLRGFHTLEFLLFKDGEPRKVK